LDFIHHQLGHRQRGEIVEIHLDARANVRLLNSSQFAAYKAGRSFRAIQGQATSSPIRWQIPQKRPVARGDRLRRLSRPRAVLRAGIAWGLGSAP
jgi:hypothetical protein